jgi:hypothetical protein
MHLHSMLDGRAGQFRVRGAAWALDSRTLRGFLYLMPVRRDGNGQYRVVEAEGEDVWNLLDALSKQVSSISGAAVKRLDARAVTPDKRVRNRSPNRSQIPSRPLEIP